MTSEEYINSIVIEGDKQYQLREYYYKKLLNVTENKGSMKEIEKAFNQYKYYKNKVNEYMTILEHLDKLYTLMEEEYGRNNA